MNGNRKVKQKSCDWLLGEMKNILRRILQENRQNIIIYIYFTEKRQNDSRRHCKVMDFNIHTNNNNGS